MLLGGLHASALIPNLADTATAQCNVMHIGVYVVQCDAYWSICNAMKAECWALQSGGAAKVAGQKRQGAKGPAGGVVPSRKVGTRCLAIMEQLAGGVGDAGRGLLLADALMPLLQQSASARYLFLPLLLYLTRTVSCMLACSVGTAPNSGRSMDSVWLEIIFLSQRTGES